MLEKSHIPGHDIIPVHRCYPHPRTRRRGKEYVVCALLFLLSHCPFHSFGSPQPVSAASAVEAKEQETFDNSYLQYIRAYLGTCPVVGTVSGEGALLLIFSVFAVLHDIHSIWRCVLFL
jgi:hypothetical protein